MGAASLHCQLTNPESTHHQNMSNLSNLVAALSQQHEPRLLLAMQAIRSATTIDVLRTYVVAVAHMHGAPTHIKTLADAVANEDAPVHAQAPPHTPPRTPPRTPPQTPVKGMHVRYRFQQPHGWQEGHVLHRHRPNTYKHFFVVQWEDGTREAVRMTPDGYGTVWNTL